MKKTIRKIFELRRTLHKCNYFYYIMNAPLISDNEYDILFRELQKLEEKFPEEFDLQSPTQIVGSLPVDKLMAMGIEIKKCVASYWPLFNSGLKSCQKYQELIYKF